MTNLYQLDDQLKACIKVDEEHVVDVETGEVLDLEQYFALAEAVETKIDNTACYIKSKRAEAAAIKAEEENLKKRRIAAEKEAERCTDYLACFMAHRYDAKKFKSARNVINWRASESVEVSSIDALPDKYLRFKDPEPDKTKIKAALKAGVELKGCQLVAKQNLQIK